MKKETLQLKPNQVALHGECTIMHGNIPKNATPLVLEKGQKQYIIADSETTGNHHVLDLPPKAKMYTLENRVFLSTPVPVTVHCVMTERHDSIELAAGDYEFGTQMEYDPFEARLKKVQD